jgi:Cu(I)/Ag(I) efflux system protein CusF
MKFALAAASLLIASPAFAQADGADPHLGHHPEAAPGSTVEAAGQIKSVDAKAGTVTIHHGPIADLSWPAMTMTFKATPEALQAAKAGQSVKFTLKTADNQVVAVRPQ